MRRPENGRGPEPKPEANTTLTSNDSSTATAIMDRPSTTRTCSDICWCHTGSSITWPYPHEAFLGEMFRQIRLLEITEGVLGI
jgi:hypothetical protein